MRDIILLRSKNVRFTFNMDIWKQKDVAASSSALRLVLASIIMVELENIIIPRWSNHLYFSRRYQGRVQRFWKGRVLYVNNHDWPAKIILGFRWSKKAEITLETIIFWQNISINIFKFSPFLSIKSYQFFKIY